MEVKTFCPFLKASNNLKCERENKTLEIQNKWENCAFLETRFHFYTTSLVHECFGYVSQAIMQTALYL